MANDGVYDPVNHGRRRFLSATTAVVGAVGVGFVAVPFIKSWNPSARAKLAGAPVTADISALQEGQRLILEWRGQPIWIVKRSKAILEALPTLDGMLKDPESGNPDQQPEYVLEANPELRSIKPDISVLVGLCTHLGCSPSFRPEVAPADLGAEWVGGYFCACHGSRYDLAGRVYKSQPAPLNLPVPPHSYESDEIIVVGVDTEKA